jgi:aspartate/methionine/tyrosine aminotransferase
MDAVQAPIIPIVAGLIERHPGTISLGQGVVSYSPPPSAIAALSDCFQDPNNHKYQSVQGIPPLLAAIAHKLTQENRIALDDRAIVVTAGSNMGFLNAVLAITHPGDEVILQTPYYFNHEMAVTIAGCRAVLVPTDAQYQLQPNLIEQAIGDRTRAIVTISPNNPTGAVYPKPALQAVNELCHRYGVYHIHDEAYEYFLYDGASHYSPASFAGSTGHTISLFTLSKAYGFASWRIGYMVIPRHLLLAVQKIQDTNVICPSVVAQYAAWGALQAGVAYCQQHLVAIAQVRQSILQQLHQVAHLCTIPPSNGAFYFLLKVHTELDAMTVVEQLIKQHGVAVIPGNTFGLHQGCYLRVAYGALQPDTATAGVDRLVHGLQEILS